MLTSSSLMRTVRLASLDWSPLLPLPLSGDNALFAPLSPSATYGSAPLPSHLRLFVEEQQRERERAGRWANYDREQLTWMPCAFPAADEGMSMRLRPDGAGSFRDTFLFGWPGVEDSVADGRSSVYSYGFGGRGREADADTDVETIGTDTNEYPGF